MGGPFSISYKTRQRDHAWDQISVRGTNPTGLMLCIRKVLEGLGVKVLKTPGSVLKLQCGGCGPIRGPKSYMRMNESVRMCFSCWDPDSVGSLPLCRHIANHCSAAELQWILPQVPVTLAKHRQWEHIRKLVENGLKKEFSCSSFIPSDGAWLPFGPLLNCCASEFGYLRYGHQRTDHQRWSWQLGPLYLFNLIVCQ